MIDRIARFLTAVSFHRGLALGAMVGAAIAGSTLWSHLRAVRDTADAEAAGSGPPDQPTLSKRA